jgi:hypothetical protein
MRCLIAALLSDFALSTHPALADITRPAIVTDGNSIKIARQRICHHGIVPNAQYRRREYA